MQQILILGLARITRQRGHFVRPVLALVDGVALGEGALGGLVGRGKPRHRRFMLGLVDAELWEIAENLHRAELTALERSEQVARWIELTAVKQKLAQPEPVSKGGRGNEGGVRAAARDLGIEKEDARRATKVAALSDEAKQAAREAGLDDNRSALLQAARQHGIYAIDRRFRGGLGRRERDAGGFMGHHPLASAAGGVSTAPACKKEGFFANLPPGPRGCVDTNRRCAHFCSGVRGGVRPPWLAHLPLGGLPSRLQIEPRRVRAPHRRRVVASATASRHRRPSPKWSWRAILSRRWRSSRLIG